ncbi:MAG: type IV toxin-antitoxin system AbiEi family antitoxin domain-containing protein [Candidatus Micrarchaeia archaeon]
MTKYIGTIRKRFGSTQYPVFTLADLRVALSQMHVSQIYLKMLINHLIKRGEIIRITKGVYTFHNDLAVVGFAFRPFYYGLEDALSYRNLWTQMTNPVVMTTNVVREGPRKFANANYIVKRIDPKHFFGFDFVKYYDFWLPVSDAEKTLIDLVYYRHGVREEAMGPLASAIDVAKLEGYLENYSGNFRKRVMKVLNEGMNAGMPA